MLYEPNEKTNSQLSAELRKLYFAISIFVGTVVGAVIYFLV